MHEGLLPPESARLISGRFRQVLSFVLSYLESRKELSGVKVMISGGYVRDILLGRMSDDLDLTLDLRSCDPGMTVDAIAEGLPGFADATTALHDLEDDPGQQSPLADRAVEDRLCSLMKAEMAVHEAPAELFTRFDLT